MRLDRVESSPRGKLFAGGIPVRLFVTCWLIYSLHFSSNIVREIYLGLALGDHFSFRVDEYRGLHPDLFEKPGYGWHINGNPGASMLAAIPYALARPAIDRVTRRVQEGRMAAGGRETPAYESPWPMAREFFAEAWRRGYDMKFGLAAFVMQSFCMAPISALGVLAVFYPLRYLLASERHALWLALLYAFGTPVFFRTGFLNHNMMMGHIVFLGFLALWNPGGLAGGSPWKRFVIAGLAGGMAVLFDYGGVLFLAALLVYGLVRQWGESGAAATLRLAAMYSLGALGPLLLLVFYQWRSFGHPFYPPQHWMPATPFSGAGYHGFGVPQPELLAALLFDYRFGLFVAGPLMVFALAAPFLERGPRRRIHGREMAALLGFFLLCWLFYGGVNYTWLQYNTGIRYLAAVFPFLYLPAALVLARLPRAVLYFVGAFAVAESWCLAMHRDVERGLGVLDPILHVFLGGFKLPILTVLSNMKSLLPEHLAGGVSPLPLFTLTAAVLYGVWRFPRKDCQ